VTVVDRIEHWSRRSLAELDRSHVPSPSLRTTILALTVASALAALVADRFGGPDGPWLWNYDMPPAYFPFASFFHDALTLGHLPLWTDSVYFGLPLYAEGQSGVFYPPNWLIYQLPPLQALDVARILHLTLAGVGAGFIVLRLAGSRTGALAAALIVVLCGGISAKLGWTNVVATYAWMPWILVPLLRQRPRTPARGIVLAGSLWGLQALAGYPPYWVLTGVLAAVLLLWQQPNLIGLRRTVVFGFIGVTIGAVQLIPTALLTTLSPHAHGLDAGSLFEFSATPFDFLGLAFANALVPAASPAWDITQSWYPGGMWAFVEAYTYIGLPALGLAAAGLTVRRARPLAILALVAIAIPVIGVLQPSVWTIIPGLNGLRHPVRAYLVLDLALAVAAGFGVARLGARRGFRTALIVIGLALAGYFLVLGLAVMGPREFDALWTAVQPGRENVVREQVIQSMTRLWPLAFEIAVAALALILMYRWKRTSLTRLGAVGLVALPMALLVPGINQSLPSSAFSPAASPIVDRLRQLGAHTILMLDGPYDPQLVTVLGPDAVSLPHVLTIHFSTSLHFEATDTLVEALRGAGSNTAQLRAVGVDTVVAFGGPCPGRPVAVDQQYSASICRIDGALRPPYWVPATAVLLLDDRPSSLITPAEAIIEPHGAAGGAVPATVLSWDDGQAQLEVTAPTSGFVFIDRSWWPLWQVSVDGSPVTPYRAWSGQLVPVGAGHHVIEEHLFPADALLGAAMTGATVVLLGLLWLRDRRRRPSLRDVGNAPAGSPGNI